MSQSRGQWKETPKNIYKDSIPDYLKEDLSDKEPKYFKPRAIQRPVKDLPWSQRNAKLIQLTLVPTALLIIFSKLIYDIFNSYMNPRLPTIEEVQLYPRRKPEVSS